MARLVRRKPKRELMDLEIYECSLVDLPAIQKSFLLYKRDDSNDFESNSCENSSQINMFEGGTEMFELSDVEIEKREKSVLEVIGSTVSKLEELSKAIEEETDVEKKTALTNATTNALSKIASKVLKYCVNKAQKPEDYEKYEEVKKEDYKDFMAQCMGGGKGMKECAIEWKGQVTEKQEKEKEKEKYEYEYEEKMKKKEGEISKLTEELSNAKDKKPPEYYEYEEKVKKQEDKIKELTDELAAMKEKYEEKEEEKEKKSEKELFDDMHDSLTDKEKDEFEKSLIEIKSKLD